MHKDLKPQNLLIINDLKLYQYSLRLIFNLQKGKVIHENIAL